MSEVKNGRGESSRAEGMRLEKVSKMGPNTLALLNVIELAGGHVRSVDERLADRIRAWALRQLLELHPEEQLPPAEPAS